MEGGGLLSEEEQRRGGGNQNNNNHCLKSSGKKKSVRMEVAQLFKSCRPRAHSSWAWFRVSRSMAPLGSSCLLVLRSPAEMSAPTASAPAASASSERRAARGDALRHGCARGGGREGARSRCHPRREKETDWGPEGEARLLSVRGGERGEEQYRWSHGWLAVLSIRNLHHFDS